MKKRILMVGPARSVHGGVSAVVNNYYKADLEQKVHLTYVATMVDGSKLRKLAQALLSYIRVLFLLPGSNIVHVHMASDSSIYRKSIIIKMSSFFRKPIVLHQHGGNFVKYYEECSTKKKKFICNILNRATVLIVLSEEWKNYFKELFPEERIRVLENSIVIPEITGKTYEDNNILFLGRISNDKGIRELFVAVRELSNINSDFCLYLGGLWEDRELRLLAENDKEHIHFLGWIGEEEKRKYLKKCSIFVLPSYFEGQPVSLLEAMGAGCVSVASRVGGIPQILGEEEGILIPPKDANALQSALVQLLNNTQKKEKMGMKASEKIKKQYDIKTNIQQLLQIYDTVIRRVDE